MHSFSLHPFETSPTTSAVSKYQAALIPTGGGHLHLTFEFEASPLHNIDLGMAPTDSQTWGYELWRQTCFELFLSFPGVSEYWEWNFSSWGEVCCYKFSRYRVAMPLDVVLRDHSGGLLRHKKSMNDSHFKIAFDINLNVDNLLWWYLENHSQVELSLTGVLKDKAGKLSYWAHSHSAPKADFHDRKSWSRLKI